MVCACVSVSETLQFIWLVFTKGSVAPGDQMNIKQQQLSGESANINVPVRVAILQQPLIKHQHISTQGVAFSV